MATTGKAKVSYRLDEDGVNIHQITTYADGSNEYTDSMTLTDLRKTPVGEYFKKYSISGNGEIKIGKTVYVKDKGDRNGFRFYKYNDINDEQHSQPNRLVVTGWYMG